MRPLPVVLFGVSVAMCVGSAAVALHGVARTPKPLNPAPYAVSAEHAKAANMIGVAGQTAVAWDRTIRVPASLAVSYISMGKPVNRAFTHWTERDAHGARPVIEILPYDRTLQGIIKGNDDTWLRALRRAIDEPVVLSFGPEGNGTWYPWSQHPDLYRAAWHHVVKIIGHRDVTWLWQMSAHKSFAAYWPGAKYVNWVGLDGYFQNPRTTFDSLFGRVIQQARRFTRDPVVLSETGVGPGANHVVRDVRALFSGATSHHVIGVIWFDRKKKGSRDENWLLTANAAELRGFRSAARLYEKH